MSKKIKHDIVRSSAAEYLTYIAANGESGVEIIYADENIWITQKMMGILYNVETHTINYHIKNIFSDNELEEKSVIRDFRITASDSKNYLNKKEMAQLQRLVSAYLDLAEDMALREIPMTMADWETRLNRFIAATDRKVLQDAGKVTAQIAKAHAETEFEKYRIVQDRLFESDFDKLVKKVKAAKKGGEK